MSNVYLLTAGCYSDYHIVGAFSSRKLAEEAIDKLSERKGDYYNGFLHDLPEIEEYELDKTVEYYTTVCMYKDGRVRGGIELRTYLGKDKYKFYPYFLHAEKVEQEWVRKNDTEYYKTAWVKTGELYLVNTVRTKDETKAIKATNELRARLIAQDLWYENSHMEVSDDF